jgi:hypothetical protein
MPDDDTRRHRKRQADRGEHVLEDRDNEEEERGDGDRGNGEDDARVDHRPLHLPDEGVVLFHERRQTQQDDVENTARLTGGHHVDVQLGERFRVLAQRVGEGVAALDIEDDVARDAGERFVFRLLGQDVERLNEREPGVDHRRKLPSEDHDVAHLDAAALAGGRFLFLGLVLVLDDRQSLAPELRDDVVARGGVDGGGFELATSGASGVRERGHLSFSPCIGRRRGPRIRAGRGLAFGREPGHPCEFIGVAAHP